MIWAGRPDPFDVEVFARQWARLYPRDNLSEKRAFVAPQFWDAEERAALAAAITAHDPALGPFVFVDAGANAGLYSLAARSAAVPGGLRLIAIEPEPETCARLRFNLAASGASAEASIVEAALAPEDGTLRMTAAGTNRGEVSVSAAGEGVEVAARTLHGIATAEGLSRID
ncbi:MAG: FkbM family methyltransferase, partial [Pseudomonadota bacterium]